jgi:hypothetical protein
MKLFELGIDVNKQIKNPTSPGSRGVALNKNNPPKRYFDIIAKLPKQNNRQK